MTEAQRNALHLWLTQLSEALNDAGYSVRKTLRHDFDLPWNKNLAKELLWRPIQKAMTEKRSSEDLDKLEPSEIFEVLNLNLGQKLGIHVPWPCEETLAEERRKA